MFGRHRLSGLTGFRYLTTLGFGNTLFGNLGQALDILESASDFYWQRGRFILFQDPIDSWENFNVYASRVKPTAPLTNLTAHATISFDEMAVPATSRVVLFELPASGQLRYWDMSSEGAEPVYVFWEPYNPKNQIDTVNKIHGTYVLNFGT